MKYTLVILTLLTFFGCRKTDIHPKSSLKTIYSFRIKANNNPGLTNDIEGVISHDSIILNVGATINVSSLVPTISFGGVSLLPYASTPQNYTSPVVYTVTAEDGSQKNYKTYLNILTGTKSISSFIFKASNNVSLSSDLTGIISGDSILLQIPAGIPLNSLVPTITYIGQSLSPQNETANNFTYPANYQVTAQDGSHRNYTVFVSANKDIYIHGDDGYVYDINAINGTVKWKFNTGGSGVPTYDNGLVFVNGSSNYSNLIYALNAVDGTVVWTSSPPPGNYSLTMPAVKYGKIYFAGSGLLNYTGSIYAYSTAFILSLNENTGAVEWIRSYLPQQPDYNSSQAANTNVIVSDNLAIVYDIYNGLYALDANTGDSVWRRVGDMLGRSNPLILNHTIYYGFELGLRAVNESNGQEIWHNLNYGTSGSPSSDGNNIIVANPYLSSLDVNGNPVWSVPVDGNIITAYLSPFYDNGKVFINNSRHQLTAYSAGSGTLIWTREHFPNYPIAANNEIFICNDSAQLACLDAKTGNTKWVNGSLKIFTQPACLVDGQNKAYHITESGEQN